MDFPTFLQAIEKLAHEKSSKYNGMVRLYDMVRDDGVNIYADAYEKSEGYIDVFEVARCEPHRINRIMFVANKMTADFSREYVAHCNGLIVDTNEWRVVCVPSCAFNLQAPPRRLKKRMYAKDVFEATDGTAITLYWYGGKWCVGSATGFDIGGKRWFFNITYMTAITDVLEREKVDMQALSTTHSYSIVFTHRDFHLFAPNQPKAYLLLECDNSKTIPEVCATPTISLARQRSLADAVPESANWPATKIYDYIEEANDRALTSYLNGNIVHFGYYIRGDFATYGDIANVIMESSLMKAIRTLLYDLPRSSVVVPQDRVGFMALKAYLRPSTHTLFTKLFPSQLPTYTLISQIITQLVGGVMSCARNKRTRANIARQNDRYGQMVWSYYRTLSETVGFFEKNGPEIVRDFISSPRNIGDLFQYYLEVSTDVAKLEQVRAGELPIVVAQKLSYSSVVSEGLERSTIRSSPHIRRGALPTVLDGVKVAGAPASNNAVVDPPNASSVDIAKDAPATQSTAEDIAKDATTTSSTAEDIARETDAPNIITEKTVPEETSTVSTAKTATAGPKRKQKKKNNH